MKRVVMSLSLMLGALACGPASAAILGPVHVDGGAVAGAQVAGSAVSAFKGLPYAAAPVGALRWRAPADVVAWSGVRDASLPGSVCPQAPSPEIAGLKIDEDCLNLDVWTAAGGARERRPVMVWFHGGERGAGGASQAVFDGTALARKGVVVVTVNYRGNALGLLAMPQLSQENAHHVSGNYALLDNIAALKWVRRNIAAFGGDPQNVTIFGQSFGAGTSHFLSLSPLAKGLFHRMITQSHALYPRDPVLSQVAMKHMSLVDAEADGLTFMHLAGARSVADLRALPWQKLVDAYRQSAHQLLWSYVIDGYVLPRDYAETYAAGAQADVSVIAGENGDENGAASDKAFDLVAAGRAKPPGNSIAFLGLSGYRDYAHRKFGAMADEFLRLYPAANDREAFASANAAIRDNGRISPWMWASAFTQKRDRPVYLYVFTQAPPGPDHDLTGTYHGADLRYVFDNPEPGWGPQDRRVADIVSSYWVNFARTGNPNGPGLPNWPAYDGGARRTMELGRQFGPIPLADPAKIAFWQRFYATQPAR